MAELPEADDEGVHPEVVPGITLHEGREHALRPARERAHGFEPRAVEVVATQGRERHRARPREALPQRRERRELAGQIARGGLVAEGERDVGRAEFEAAVDPVVGEVPGHRRVGHHARPEHRRDDRQPAHEPGHRVGARGVGVCVADRAGQPIEDLGLVEPGSVRYGAQWENVDLAFERDRLCLRGARGVFLRARFDRGALVVARARDARAERWTCRPPQPRP
ncbi:MAG: hypothetical protein U0324_16575 [Polyangiales bacterium]